MQGPDQSGKTESKARPAKKSDWFLLIAVSLFILSFAVLYFALPDTAFSSLENRSLQKKPSVSVDSVLSGRFSEELDDFYTDQLPARKFFLSEKAFAELSMGKQENGSVILALNGYLVKRLEYPDLSELEKNLGTLKAFSEKTEEMGIRTITAIAPRTVDELDEFLPDWFDTSYAAQAWQTVEDSGLSFMDFRPYLKETSKTGFWYKTDHHWTTTGAYVAYSMICSSFSCMPSMDYERVTVTEDFKGTSYSASGMYWTSGEPLVLFRYPGDQSFDVKIDGDPAPFEGFYDLTAPGRGQGYEIFFGGNYARLSIRSGEAGRPKLLVFKDSFANSVLPFLAQQFDLEVVDLRYCRESVRSLIEEISPDCILVLYGLDTLSSPAFLPKLS